MQIYVKWNFYFPFVVQSPGDMFDWRERMGVQRLVSAVLGVALLAVSAGPVQAGSTETAALWDTRGHWAEANIRAAAAAGWVKGYPDGTFKPEGEVTRAEFIKMLGSLAGAPSVIGDQRLQVLAPFLAEQDHWVAQQGHVRGALAAGFLEPADYTLTTNGNAIGSWYLAPDQPLTRQEAAVLIVRALGYDLEAQRPSLQDDVAATPLSFADAGSIPVWLYEWVEIAKRTGIIGGYPDGTFQPGNRIKRAEAVVMLQRFDAQEPVTPDVTQELRRKQPDCMENLYRLDPRRTNPLRAEARAAGPAPEVYEAFKTLSAAEQEQLLREHTLAFWVQVKDRNDLGQNRSGVKVELLTENDFVLASATYDGTTFTPKRHLPALGTATPDVLARLGSAFTLTVENLDGQVALSNKAIDRDLPQFLAQISQAECTVTYALPYQYLGEWFSANPGALSAWVSNTAGAQFAAKQTSLTALGGNLARLKVRIIPDTNYQFSPYKDLDLLGTLRANPVLEASYNGQNLTVERQAASLAGWVNSTKLVYLPPPLVEVPPPNDPAEPAARQVFETFIYTLGRLPN